MTVRWGIASTGNIAGSMVEALAGVDGAEVVAVGSRAPESARSFADRHGIERAHGSYAELWADDGVDVMYIGSPHSEHHSMTIAALDAGRHVLCEKAFALNHREASEMIDAARSTDRFLMEAMWSWFMPGWEELRRRIADGVIGEVTVVEADFGLDLPDPDGRHRRRELGGGAMLDLGIYPLSLGRWLLGEPTDVTSDVRVLGSLTDDGVDDRVAGVVRHPSGALTVFHTGLDATSSLTARVVGTDGSISIDAPFWFPSRFTIRPSGGDPEAVEVPNRGLAHEAEHVMACLTEGRIESDVMTWETSLANMALLDEIRRQLGVVYDVDDGADGADGAG